LHGVGERGNADQLVPAVHGNLADDDQRALVVKRDAGLIPLAIVLALFVVLRNGLHCDLTLVLGVGADGDRRAAGGNPGGGSATVTPKNAAGGL
jgi:hypothetical protein